MYTIRYYILPTGKALVREWLKDLRDMKTRTRIVARLSRLEKGNLGDYSMLCEDFFELRFHFGPGWRLYCALVDGVVVLLLGGGDKSTQPEDIATARR